MDIIKSENNIYFFVFATLLITVLKKFIPNNIIDLFNGEPYNVAMLIIMIYIGKTNIILAIIILIFFLFSSTLHITKFHKSKSNIEGNNTKPVEEFNGILNAFTGLNACPIPTTRVSGLLKNTDPSTSARYAVVTKPPDANVTALSKISCIELFPGLVNLIIEYLS